MSGLRKRYWTWLTLFTPGEGSDLGLGHDGQEIRIMIFFNYFNGLRNREKGREIAARQRHN